MFWNIKKRNLSKEISDAASSLDLNLIGLIEAPAEIDEASFEGKEGRAFVELLAPTPPKVRLFFDPTRLSLSSIRDGLGKRHRFAWVRQGSTKMLLVAAHLVSQDRTSEDERMDYAKEVAQEIGEVEQAQETDKTILVGDLNMNPFDNAMTNAASLHSFMSADVASAGHRRVRGREFSMFYNPMWSLLGDRSPGPPGSYFYIGDRISTHWNLFDQVLVRPSLIPALGQVEVIRTTGAFELASAKGRPNSSDHFPLLFEIHPHLIQE